MAMTDMKRTKADKKAEDKKYDSPMRGDDYPYGLTVRLDHHSLKKLGMHEGAMPKVGARIKLHAHAHVVSASEHSEEGGEPRRSMELQLRHMEIPKHGEGRNLEKPDGDTEVADLHKGAKHAMDKVLAPKQDGSENADGDEA